jgi:hypothetical protein
MEKIAAHKTLIFGYIRSQWKSTLVTRYSILFVELLDKALSQINKD